ncbi:hypothetical protein PIB30_103899, partial [Stylosanthes scabra]|nr:hypothetical protein [Stylosanthes scabra]
FLLRVVFFVTFPFIFRPFPTLWFVTAFVSLSRVQRARPHHQMPSHTSPEDLLPTSSSFSPEAQLPLDLFFSIHDPDLVTCRHFKDLSISLQKPLLPLDLCTPSIVQILPRVAYSRIPQTHFSDPIRPISITRSGLARPRNPTHPRDPTWPI